MIDDAVQLLDVPKDAGNNWGISKKRSIESRDLSSVDSVLVLKGSRKFDSRFRRIRTAGCNGKVGVLASTVIVKVDPTMFAAGVHVVVCAWCDITIHLCSTCVRCRAFFAMEHAIIGVSFTFTPHDFSLFAVHVMNMPTVKEDPVPAVSKRIPSEAFVAMMGREFFTGDRITDDLPTRARRLNNVILLVRDVLSYRRYCDVC